MNFRPLYFLLTLVGAAAQGSTQEEAASLGDRLTPYGAERAGDATGAIPAWTGGLESIPEGTWPKTGWADQPPGEAPILSIGPEELPAYADFLPEGQQALLRKFKDYRILVYKTHRTAAAPQSVYDAIRRNAISAGPSEAGIAHGVVGAVGGIPFPIPTSGSEIVWNHLLAYWGAAREDRLRTYVMRAGGRLELTHRYDEVVDFPYYYASAAAGSFGPYYFKRREISLGPPALAGRGYIAWEPIDSADSGARIWQSVPGQHRVRQAPALSYDTPTEDGAGILSYDDYYVFSGAPDRYDFRLLGKRAMFIPYNNNRFATLDAADIALPGHIRPEALRYELHRVWVVDATLLPGQHHLAAHRRLYFDEDTWFAVYCDAWDDEGNLWKFSHGTMFDIPELPAVILGSVVTYDIQNGGYVLSFAFNGEPEVYHPTKPHSPATFEPATLAADGTN
jgi:hypothetical protein